MSPRSHFTGILEEKSKYKYLIHKDDKLKELSLDDIQSGKTKLRTICMITWNEKKLAVSRWVSAKRTRSEPYARVYKTLAQEKIPKATVIPIVKSEGIGGDTDYIAWDTFSICSFLGVYVVAAYYSNAKESSKPKYKGTKITSQEFDRDFLYDKFKSILTTNLTPQEWNEKERSSLAETAYLAVKNYEKISKETRVKINTDNLKTELEKFIDPEGYKNHSHKKSGRGQKAETKTSHFLEDTFGFDKGTVTLSDSKGGYYPWTVDAVLRKGNVILLMEMKNTTISKTPSSGEIEDALFKFHFYANLREIKDENGKKLKSIPIIILSSSVTSGCCFNTCPYFEPSIDPSSKCLTQNCNFDDMSKYNRYENLIQKNDRIQMAFKEAALNNIIVIAVGKKNESEKALTGILDYLVSKAI